MLKHQSYKCNQEVHLEKGGKIIHQLDHMYVTNNMLCNKSKAIEAGRKAIEILGFNKDAYSGFYPEMDMLKILLIVGEYDEVLSRLEVIISQHGYLSVELLKIDPFWNPVREMDKFQEIISNPKYQVSLLDN